MSAVSFEPGTYYELRSNVIFLQGEEASLRLRREEIVFCTGIIWRRNAEEGSGKYAQLLVRRDGTDVTLYHRVSRFNRGAGVWREVDPMIILAKASEVPTP